MTSHILEKSEKYLSKRRYGGNREKVLIRDKRQCRFCGDNINLCVHHKDFNTKNNKLNNLITLCAGCHRRFHKSKLVKQTKNCVKDLEKIINIKVANIKKHKKNKLKKNEKIENRNATIYKLRIGNKMTYTEIGKKFNLTGRRIHQIIRSVEQS
jgi:5-methylcytosine-specific restriction endonuclease McrA